MKKLLFGRKVNTPAIGNELFIEINDGLFEYDAANKTACFTSFGSKDLKNAALAKIKRGQGSRRV